MKNAGELDVDEELDVQMRAVLMWMKSWQQGQH